MTEPARRERKPRTDSLRNRERVLEAAKAVFSEGGTEAGLAAVARRAGVGIGTLYRHFSTREALYEAVYRREVEQLAEFARQLAGEVQGLQGLRRFVQAVVQFIATKKGMAAALALATHKPPELMAFSAVHMHEAIAMLLAPAVDSGEARGDIGPEDLMRTIIGLAYLQEGPGWQERVTRLVDVFLDGLRLRPGEPADRPAQSAQSIGSA
ncbi:TetR/AcrR family transcriptional regulator [Plastoroseomonas arctica]|uniref:TetR/AcrR family transcriptional regulator n=1 Tax=Plastoroseomonas arctica TaxID=1509237 RepID=A0AAF1KJZ0_9PROT|nr:TetR/AcrR family transcriptional regulator [Plastoroseomonas arctica]MBR0656055.1 TetR/AcrR family transcriptional regulator [Plastoroseomonas arctica]